MFSCVSLEERVPKDHPLRLQLLDYNLLFRWFVGMEMDELASNLKCGFGKSPMHVPEAILRCRV